MTIFVNLSIIGKYKFILGLFKAKFSKQRTAVTLICRCYRNCRQLMLFLVLTLVAQCCYPASRRHSDMEILRNNFFSRSS